MSGKLEIVGRATRAMDEDGHEIWRLPLEDASVAGRLLALGKANVGGFVRGGEDAEGAWLERSVAARTLGAIGHGDRADWRAALRIARGVAIGLAACEKAGLFPGPLRPEQIVVEPDVWLVAEELVCALVGAPTQGRVSSLASPKWTPPEQASGAPWDNASNRYVLGLVLYRLLAGKMPFGGAGLRHALAEQRAAPAPFEDVVARRLRPGVQSLVLALLDPRPESRPCDAASIVIRCDELLERQPAASHEAPVAAGSPRARPVGGATKDRATGTKRVRPARGAVPVVSRGVVFGVMLPLALGALLALLLIARAGARDRSPAPPPIRPVEPLKATTAADCAGCHPRQVAEWERSVMAHAVRSPLFGALESLVEEQVGRDEACPNGAGILRRVGASACRARATGITVTGAGGEHWCVNCHSPGDNILGAPSNQAPAASAMPVWNALGSPRARGPVRDLLTDAALEGISCAACHETVGPVGAHGTRSATAGSGYEGNPTWTSLATGGTFLSRPEDLEGRSGIANSGYRLDPRIFLGASVSTRAGEPTEHRRPPRETTAYLRTSEFCGACHDVRLFGTDAIGAARGEHFKRLRNAYSEWRAWAQGKEQKGETPATCQGCHMSLYPGVCVAGGGHGGAAARADSWHDCPAGTHFEPRPPGEVASGSVAVSSTVPSRIASHYFSSIDVPLTPSFPDVFADDPTLDVDGVPIGLLGRRSLMLHHTLDFRVEGAQRSGQRLEIPVRIENTGAGHRVPAGFSQEREIWVEMTIKDARGGIVYEVGKISADDADLRDKIFARVETNDQNLDRQGRPLGLFGADVIDGPDVPEWSPNPRSGGTKFRGRGLITLQNGFLRCVRCIGQVDAQGRCQPGQGQGRTRADRFDDGAYDPDSGECRSNLTGDNALFETYFPVGALDADRGIAKAPDAIIDTRSAPPDIPFTYTYVLDAGTHPPPFVVEARLRFRSFPPFLVRAFADYEARKSAEGLRPSGPQVTLAMLRRIAPVDVGRAEVRIE
jgi:hypothetical protein